MNRSNKTGWSYRLFPKSLWTRRFTIAWSGCLATILAFDLLWSMATSFRALSFPATYIFAATLATLMALPAAVWRRRWPTAAVLVIADLLAMANLMYCRTYFGPIPPASYLMAGNVAEFGDAIRHSLRLADLAFPIITVVTLAMMGKALSRKAYSRRPGIKPWLVTFGIEVCACAICAACYGGLLGHIEHLKEECYYRATPPVIYTLPVSILADMLESNRPVSKEEIATARSWMNKKETIREQSMIQSDSALNPAYKPDNIVMIIVESLEAWPLGKSVERQEITPNLNRLMKDTANTWFAPHVLSQVGPGRSIDGQLLMTAGLLPMADFVYSMKFPDHTYPHLAQVFRADRGMKSYLLSGDRATTWNQGAVAKSFGIDEVRFRDSWDASESFGHPRNPSDRSFLRQVAGKMKTGEIWPEGENAFVEVITYSSHFPFTIPQEHRRINLSAEYPAPLGDYITAINYTDHALGEFIDYLQSRPDASRTMIVIVGDHEALASWREPIRATSPSMMSLVDPESFVPMIVLNSPVAGRRDAVMGQVDVYTTILDIAGLIPSGRPMSGASADIFPGMGFSGISSLPGFAIDLNGHVSGDTTGTDPALFDLVKSSYAVSSTIIRANLLASDEAEGE